MNWIDWTAIGVTIGAAAAAVGIHMVDTKIVYTPGENLAAVTLVANGKAICSGTYIGNGYFLSAEHCYIKGTESRPMEYTVIFNKTGEEIPVTFASWNQEEVIDDTDLALFFSSEAYGKPKVTLDCTLPEVGEEIWMTGNPGIPPHSEADEWMSTTFGYVTSLLPFKVRGAGDMYSLTIQSANGMSGSGIMTSEGLSFVLSVGLDGTTFVGGTSVQTLCELPALMTLLDYEGELNGLYYTRST